MHKMDDYLIPCVVKPAVFLTVSGTESVHSSFCDDVLHQDRGAGLGRVQVQYQTLGMRPDHQVVRWWTWNSVPPFQRS